MPIPTFVQLHDHDMKTGYFVTNETPELFTQMMLETKGRVDLAGGICSGGEVPLFTLLQVAERVIVVDHTVGALVAAFIKIGVLDKLGAKATRQLLTRGILSEFMTVARDVKELLPAPLKAYFDINSNTIFSEGYTWPAVCREWLHNSVEVLEVAHKKLDRLTLVHGDLKDLIPFGPFDCLYTSNAINEHQNRDGVYPKLEEMNPLVKSDGVILTTSGISEVSEDIISPKGWHVLKKQLGGRTSWSHAVIQRQIIRQAAIA